MTKKEVITRFGYPYIGRFLMDTLYLDDEEIPAEVLAAMYKVTEPQPFIIITGSVGAELFKKAINEAKDAMDPNK